MTTSKSNKNVSGTPSREAKPTKKQITEVVEKTKSKAEEYAYDPEKARKLLDGAVKKAKTYCKRSFYLQFSVFAFIQKLAFRSLLLFEILLI